MSPNITGLESLIFNLSKIDSRRKKLYEALEKRDDWAYLLQGNFDGDILALIPDSQNAQFVLAKDSLSKNTAPTIDSNVEKFFNSMQAESYQELILDAEGLSSLINVYARHAGKILVDIGTRGGRPQKYSMEDAKRWNNMLLQGKSISDIADKEKVAGNTVRSWLRKLEALPLMEKPTEK